MDLTVAVFAVLIVLAVLIGLLVSGVRALARRAVRERPTAHLASSPALAPLAPPPAPIRIPIGSGDDEDFDFDIVGEGSYLGTLRRAAGGRLMAGETVVLPVLVIPEPKNKYDPNAIAVHLEGFGKVGYFQKDTALEWVDVSRALVACNADGPAKDFSWAGTRTAPTSVYVISRHAARSP